MNNITELQQNELTKKDWLKIAWAFFWRGLIIMLASLLAGGIAGGIIGFIIGFACAITHYPFSNIKIVVQVVSGLFGGAIGFVFIILQIKWVLKARYKGFHIGLIKDETNNSITLSNLPEEESKYFVSQFDNKWQP